MPRPSSSTPSSFSFSGLFKKNAKAGLKDEHEEVIVYPGGASGVSRSRKTNRRRAPPRPVGIRNSSLYGTSSSSSFYNHTSYIDSTHDIYNLQADPSVYFPTPPPRLSLTWDKRHTDIWDDLFDWAETYQASSIGTASSASSSTASRPASRATGGRSRLTCQTQLDLTSAGELKDTKKKRRLSGLFTLGKLALKSEIWSKSDMNDMNATASSSAAPSVPPRSRLRAQAPAPIASRSTSYLLPVEEPPSSVPETPIFSSGFSSASGSPQYPSASPGSDTVSFGRKKSQASLGKDPLKIRDGAEPRRSSSGVYTPPTFPGAQGPRPSHFPTHVYTPANHNLYNPGPPRPTPHSYSYTGAGPSRSASISSSESEGPSTPATNYSRLSTISGRAMSGFKRISQQITSTNTAPPIKQPMSARESYFPSSIGTEVPRVYGSPSTPNIPRPVPLSPGFSVSSPISPYGAGLGVGLAERDGSTRRLSPTSGPQTGSVLFGESTLDLSAGCKTSPQAKGRRKPVPKMLDDPLAKEMDGLRVEETIHAI